MLQFTRMGPTSSWDDGMEFSKLLIWCSGSSRRFPPSSSLWAFSLCSSSLNSLASTPDMFELGLIYKTAAPIAIVRFQQNCNLSHFQYEKTTIPTKCFRLHSNMLSQRPPLLIHPKIHSNNFYSNSLVVQNE